MVERRWHDAHQRAIDWRKTTMSEAATQDPEASAACALVVDDNAMILMDATDILEDAGFRTYSANDAVEALRLMETLGEDVDLLFTDVEMPGAMNGFQLAQLVAERWQHVRILVASGRVKPNDGDLPDGAVFVGKPFSADVVHERVNALLEEERKPRPLRQKFSHD